MILRVIGAGLLGTAVAAAAAAAALAACGAGAALLGCVAKRRAEAKAAWPKEEDIPPTPAEET